MSKTVSVTDHAVVRFLERVRGVDMTAIRNEIAGIVQSAVNLGAPMYSLDGVTYVLKGEVVVTLADSRSPSGFYRASRKIRGKTLRVQR